MIKFQFWKESKFNIYLLKLKITSKIIEITVILFFSKIYFLKINLIFHFINFSQCKIYFNSHLLYILNFKIIFKIYFYFLFLKKYI